jgi:hypothetical protein
LLNELVASVASFLDTKAKKQLEYDGDIFFTAVPDFDPPADAH